MTDSDLILKYLSDGAWHEGTAMSRDLKPGAVSWAYRSRISNINEKFAAARSCLRVQTRLGDNGCAEYRLYRYPTPESATAYDEIRRQKKHYNQALYREQDAQMVMI